MKNYVLTSKEKNTLIVYLNQELKLNSFSNLMRRLRRKTYQFSEDSRLVDKAITKSSLSKTKEF
jgi:hypothetical protein